MKKEEKEIEPDGFPKENDIRHDSHDSKSYNCDCCGKKMQFNTGFRVDAFVDTGQESYFHYYSFCDDTCAELFAETYGLVMDKTTDKENEDGVETSYTFRLADPVAAAVKTILPEDVTPEDSTSETQDAAEPEPELADNQEELFAAEEPVHEKKITECWANVVNRAKEIAEVSQKIVEAKETLKYYQKEYDALVKKQNNYILTNGNGIQLTFDDVPADQSEPTEAAAEQPPAVEPVDPDEWKMKSVRVLSGFTEKQMEKIEANFRTLGDVQEWSCKDYREKMPGIGQALQDKLIDAMSDYAVAWQQKAPKTEEEEPQQQEEADAAEPETTEESEDV